MNNPDEVVELTPDLWRLTKVSTGGVVDTYGRSVSSSRLNPEMVEGFEQVYNKVMVGWRFRIDNINDWWLTSEVTKILSVSDCGDIVIFNTLNNTYQLERV